MQGQRSLSSRYTAHLPKAASSLRAAATLFSRFDLNDSEACLVAARELLEDMIPVYVMDVLLQIRPLGRRYENMLLAVRRVEGDPRSGVMARDAEEVLALGRGGAGAGRPG